MLTKPPVSNGKLPHVYHFDSKAQVEEYARSVDIPATFFLPGFYMSNIPGGSMRQNPANGNAWTFSLPVPATTRIPLFDPADTGKFIKAAVLNRDKVLGKRILGATAYVTAADVVEGFKRVFPEAGKTASYQQLSEEEYKAALMGKGMPEFIAQELLENMLLLDQFGYYGGESLDETHAIVEDKLTTWEEHVRKSTKFPADLNRG
jgi:uncharacterized protein YbjT (DUF2867 family)